MKWLSRIAFLALGLTTAAQGAQTRALRAVDLTAVGGQEATISIRLSAVGDENALGFSLTFDPALLTYQGQTLGPAGVGAAINVNASQANAGHVGFALARPAGLLFAAGTSELLGLRFQLAPAATTTTLAFDDTPVLRESVDAGAGLLTTGYTNATVTITPLISPAFTSQPTNQTVYAGANVTLAATATGSSPLTWQWYRGSAPVSGGTNASLVLPGVTIGQSGPFQAVVSNAGGSLTSLVAVLTVLPPLVAPSIVRDPVSQVAAVGEAVVFAVAAAGSPTLRYQWRLNNGNLNGATNDTLMLTNVVTGQSGNYSVVVNNAAGQVISANASLSVSATPRIVRGVNSSVATGSDVDVPVELVGLGDEAAVGFSLAFDPARLSFRGVSQTSGLPGVGFLLNTNDAGAGHIGLALARQAGDRFPAGVSQLARVRFHAGDLAGPTTVEFTDSPVAREVADVFGNARPAVFSNATVTILSTGPAVVTDPVSQVVPIFDTATFTVGASGSIPLSFQWQCNGTNLPGATASTLVLAGVRPGQAGGYRVIVTNAVGSVTSAVATLSVPRVVRALGGAAPTGNEIDVPLQLLAGGGENALGFSLTFNPAQLAFREVRDASWPAGATLNVNTNLATSGLLGLALAQPGGQPFAPGTQQVALVRFRLATTPGVAALGFGNNPVLGELVSLAAEPLTVVYQGASVTGVLARPVFTVQPAGTNVYPQADVWLVADAAGSKPISWQWQFNGANLPTATNATLLLPKVGLSAGGNYAVIASNAAGATNSASALVQVLPPPADLIPFALEPPAQTVAGQPVTLSWSVTNAGTSVAAGPWQETLYVSSFTDGSARRALGTFVFSGSLGAAQALKRTVSVSVPADLSGPKYFVVFEDSGNWLQELDEANNLLVAPAPTQVNNDDLVVSSLDAPASAKFGQTIPVTWVVGNFGGAPANVQWIDKLYLSANPGDLSGAALLLTQPALSALAAGASYTNTQPVTLPLSSSSAPGAYFVIAVADGGNAQPEANEANNLRAAPITLTLPPLPDLAITAVRAPATALPGQSVPVSWIVTNQGTATVTGPWSEAVYLSTDAVIGADQWLASFNFTNTLPPGEFIARTQALTLPNFGSGARWFVARADSADSVPESDEQNNAAISLSATVIQLGATLAIAPATVTEGGSANATLTRNGGLADAATFTLTSLNTNRALVPPAITFAANQQAVGFPVNVVQDNFVNGDESVPVLAAAPGYASATNALLVRDDDQPTLTIAAAVTEFPEGAGADAGTAVVARNTDTNSSLVVTLISSDSAKLLVAGTVTIPAGSRAASFTISTVDNLVPNAPARVTLSATAPGFATVPVIFTIIDDDIPAVVLSLADTAITENAANPATTFTITRGAALPSRARFGLQSSAPAVASVPFTATIAPNELAVSVPVTVYDDHFVNGQRTVQFTIYAIDDTLGTPIPGTSAATNLLVNDDDGPTLSVSLAATVISESGATTGTVTRNTPATSNLVVTLQSSLLNGATVPPTMTIPLGQLSASFPIQGVNDGVAAGTRHALITASASGFNSGTASLNISDVDLPDLRPVAINVTNSALTGALVPIAFTVTNSGLSDAVDFWVDNIYLANSPAGDGLQLLAQAPRSGLALGASYTRTVSALMPQTVGTYYILVVVDQAGNVNEGNRLNNRLISGASILVSPAYRATIQADITSAVPGQVIPLRGFAYSALDNSPVPRVRVTVRALVKGTRRVFDAWSDAAGNISAWFQPLPNEAGRLSLCGDHPGIATDEVQDVIDIYGLRFGPFDLSERIYPNIPASNTVEVVNLGDLPLSGLTAHFETLPDYLVASASVSDTLAASDKIQLRYTLVATNVVSASIRTRLRISAAEGAVAFVPITITIQPLTTTLVSTPGYLDSGLVRGAQKILQFDVSNIGGIESGPIDVRVPNLPWLALSSPSNLPSLGPGQNSRVTLVLTPADNTPLTLYESSLVFAGQNGTLSVPLRLRVVSAAHGDLRVEVLDDYTYYVDGAPRVTNATVRLSDPYTGAVVAESNTFPAGAILFTGLLEGAYQMRVTADKHSTYAAPVDVVAAVQTDKSVFIDRQTVSYHWTVQPTTVEDRYQIVLEPVFETEVPVPVVTLDNPQFVLLVHQGDEGQVELRLTNHGLIAAERVTIEPPEDPILEFTPLVGVIDVLPAKSSITVPMRVRHKGLSARSLAAKSLHPAGGDFGCGTTFTGCSALPKMSVKWSWICGNDRRWHGLHAEIQYQCVDDSCWDKIKDWFKDKAGEQAKTGVINLRDLGNSLICRDSEGKLDLGCLCDMLDSLAICLGITDPCALALLKTACGIAARSLGTAIDGALQWGNCFCPNLPSLPSLSSPPPGEISPPYYESRNTIGPPGDFPHPVEIGIGWDYQGADCDPGLHPASVKTPQALAPAAVRPGGVCARVRIRLEQEVAITRSAFLGSLEIDNQSADTPLTGVQVTLDIRDEQGANANERFFIQGPDLATLTAVDGTGVLPTTSTGSAKYTFIPTHDAAPAAPKIYRFGGTLVYVAGAERVEVPLAPETLTVYPDPILHLEYFLQRDVYSDDPFTDEVEPAEPFALGLLVRNTGKGKAVNFRITSAQPKIVENEKGLLIDFKIIGAQVSTQSVTPSLTLRFGDIDAGQAQVAAFWMTATLQGKFVEYNASFQHIDALGGEKTSLIESVNLHELIHVVRANRPGDDALIDFLANDLADHNSLPDTLYFSDGSMAPVLLGSAPSVDAGASWSHLQVRLNATMPAGWAYLRMPDPGPSFRLYRVVRSDGREIPVGTNAWTTDRSFPAELAGPINENLLHLLDFDSSGSYTLYYRVKDDLAPVITSVGAGLPAAFTAPLASLDVVTSETIDLATFTVEDLLLTRNGGPNLITGSVTITSVDTNVYRIAGLAPLTGADGNYEFTVLGEGIQDFGGNLAANRGLFAWAKGSDVPVVVSLTKPLPNPRNSAVTNLDVVFSKAVDPASLDPEDLVLTLNGGPNLITAVLSITPLSPTSFRLGRLDTFTGAEGDYQLTVLGAGVRGVDDSVGQGSLAQAWTVLTTGPQLVSLEAPNPSMRNIVVQALNVTFARAIDPATFTWEDLSLTRDGGPNLVTSDVQVSRLSDTVYRLSNFTWVQGYAGKYALTVSAAGVHDLAANPGAGSLTQAWTIRLTKPAAPFNLTLAPDLGISATDGRTASNHITLSGSLGDTNLTVRVYDDTLGVDVGTALVTGTNFSLALTLPNSGAHALRAYAVDDAQNVSGNALLQVFIDQSPPDATLQAVSSRPTPLPSLDVTFSEAINDATFSRAAFTLTRDGGTNVLDNTVSLTKLNPTLYRLGSLTGLNTNVGNYVLTLSLGGLQDLAGNTGSGQVAAAWAMTGPSTNRPPVMAALTNCAIAEGYHLSLPVIATDPDAPGQTLTFALGAGAPPGAAIDPATGWFAWRPNSMQGPASYPIAVVVTDNGQPSLSATQTFAIAVRDTLPDVVVNLGRTNVVPGQTSFVPLRVNTGVNLTNLVFEVEAAPSRLNSWTLQSPTIDVLGADLRMLDSNRARITLALRAGVPELANRTLLRLAFTADTNVVSTVVKLTPDQVLAVRDDGTTVANTSGKYGKVVVVGLQPILELDDDSSRALFVYGTPGAKYLLQATPILASRTVWTPVTLVTMSNAVQQLDAPVSSLGNRFFRLVQGPALELDDHSNRALLIIGAPGATYVLESSPTLGPSAVWTPLRNVTMTNSLQQLDVPIPGNGNKFFRLAQP